MVWGLWANDVAWIVGLWIDVMAFCLHSVRKRSVFFCSESQPHVSNNRRKGMNQISECLRFSRTRFVNETQLDAIQPNSFVSPDPKVLSFFFLARDLSLGVVTYQMKMPRCDPTIELMHCLQFVIVGLIDELDRKHCVHLLSNITWATCQH
jgi:hypothetical protein